MEQSRASIVSMFRDTIILVTEDLIKLFKHELHIYHYGYRHDSVPACGSLEFATTESIFVCKPDHLARKGTSLIRLQWISADDYASRALHSCANKEDPERHTIKNVQVIVNSGEANEAIPHWVTWRDARDDWN
jgi:hypothetical protein